MNDSESAASTARRSPSDDGGETWRGQPTGKHLLLSAVCFVDPYIGVIVGYGEILRTDDGGETWRGQDTGPLAFGPFAIALWDERARRLILARDRAGKKPLFFYHDAERIVFGSPTGVTLAWGYRQVGAKMYLFVPSLGVPSESAIACTSGAG